METHAEASPLTLTDVEQTLVDHVLSGEVLDLAGGTPAQQPVDATVGRSWGPGRVIRAAVIRDILRGRLAAGGDPHGLRLRGARIDGLLDLEQLTSTVYVDLADCLLADGVNMCDATLPGVSLQRCWLEHPSQPPLAADRLTTTLLVLTRSVITAHSDDTGVSLRGAHLGQLNAEGTAIVNDTGAALDADGLNVERDVSLGADFTATGSGANSAVSFTGSHIGGALAYSGTCTAKGSGAALDAGNVTVERDVLLTGEFQAAGGGSAAVSFEGGHIGGQLYCLKAVLTSEAGGALSAGNLAVAQDVYLAGGFEATGGGGWAAVSFEGGRIGGQLYCTGAVLTSKTGPALSADSLTVARDVHLTGGFRATGGGSDGAVRLRAGHIGGQLDCTGATLDNDSGPALDARGLDVGQSVFFNQGCTATGGGDQGAVSLRNAHIGGTLNCMGTTLTSKSGPALAADRLSVAGNVFFQDGFTATGAGVVGALHLTRARLGGLEADGATVSNDTGPALLADSLVVDVNLFLRAGFTATGDGALGAVRLQGCHVGGTLDFNRATLTNGSGPALQADGMDVAGDAFLSTGFNATGGGTTGAVRLQGCHISGQLSCNGATLASGTGPALLADGLVVDASMSLGDGFNATGAGALGAVRLPGCHIGGILQCIGATLANQTGPALEATGLNVDRDVFLAGLDASGGGDEAVVLSLTEMRAGGVFGFRPARLEHATLPSARLDVDGLTYAGLPLGITTREWLQLIQKGTRSYAAQPYQYLAAALDAAGHDREARDVLIAQRQDQIDRNALTGWRERAWARFTGVMLGYGYKPSRALLYLLGVVVTSIALAVVLGAHGGLAQSSPPAAKPGVPCPTVQQVAVGLDLGTPLISTKAQCSTTNSATGEFLAVAGWTLQILAWGLATLFIAGFTSAVRKT